MEPKDRIIVALDVDRPDGATELVSMLAPHVGCFKIGLEFMNAMLVRLASHTWESALKELQVYQRLFKLLGDQIFWDGKFMDIPNTVAGATKPIAGLGFKMFNVHCLGGSAMMKKALAAAEKMKVISPTGRRPLVIGVTILTSLDHGDLIELGFYDECNIADPAERAEMEHARMERLVVRKLAWLAQEAGLDGVVASPHEIKAIRQYCQPEFKIVTPAARPAWAAVNDQKRVMTPGEAVKAGADYLVIGRPITDRIKEPLPDIASPVEAAKRIADEIHEAMKGAS